MRDMKEDRKQLIRTMCELMAMLYKFGQEKGRDGHGNDVHDAISKLTLYVVPYHSSRHMS